MGDNYRNQRNIIMIQMRILSCQIILAFIHLLSAVADCASIASFQANGTFTSDSFLAANVSFSQDLTNLTVCLRIRARFFRGERNSIVSFSHGDVYGALTAEIINKKNHTIFAVCKHRFVTGECISTDVTIAFDLGSWTHFCASLAYDETTGITQMKGFVNGDLAASATVHIFKEEYIPLGRNGAFVFGQNQESAGTSFSVDQSFSGELAQFGLWKEALSATNISEMAKCKVEENEGNLFPWNELKFFYWQIENVGMTNEPLETLCQDSALKDVLIFTEPISQCEFTPICALLGGKLPTPHNRKDLTEALEVIDRGFLELGGVCSLSKNAKFNLGIVFSNDSKQWIDQYTNETVNISEMIKRLSLDNQGRNCSYAVGNLVETTECRNSQACGVCLLQRRKILDLKGLCKNDVENAMNFDIEYRVFGQLNKKPHLRGVMNSHIYYDPKLDVWRLQSLRSPSKFLTLPNQHPKFLPIGRHTWEVASKLAVCNKEVGEKQVVTLTVCEPDMFTCSCGQCISLNNRCDNVIDCADMSDEFLCENFNYSSDYSKDSIPRDKDGNDTLIYLSVDLIGLTNVDGANLKFSADFYLNWRWRDSRLALRDLNGNTSLNALSRADMSRIWTPTIIFVNSLGTVVTGDDELTTGVLIAEDQFPSQSDYTQAYEANIYSGRTNSIKLTREFYHEYSCEFNFRYYPFDTQMCKIVFQIPRDEVDYLKLEQEGARFTGSRIMVEYILLLETIDVTTVDGISTAEYKIVFRRRAEHHVTNTILQTFVLVGVGYLTLYFHEDKFHERIMVTLTTLLVVATILASVQTNLPKTAYFKAIDWWLLFILLILVFTMVFHTYLSFHSGQQSRIENGVEKRNENSLSNMLRNFLESILVKVTKKKKPTSNNNNVWITIEPSVQSSRQYEPHVVHMVGKISFLILIIIYNAAFWTMTIIEYTRPAEYYL